MVSTKSLLLLPRIFTNKLLFVEWVLEINIAIGQMLLNKKARIESDQYVEKTEKFDMRTMPPSVRRGVLHNQDVIDERWSLCSGCEFLTEKNACKKCGCFMKVKHKLAMAECPIGKWGKYKEGIVNGVSITT